MGNICSKWVGGLQPGIIGGQEDDAIASNKNRDVLKLEKAAGMIFFGDEAKCGVAIGLPFIEAHDLFVDGKDPSWNSTGKTCYTPMFWKGGEMEVTVRTLRNNRRNSTKVSNSRSAYKYTLVEELSILRQLQHQNVLLLVGKFTTRADATLGLIFERVRLGSLFNILYIERKVLTSRQVNAIVMQAISAISYVHARGIIHRAISSHAVVMVSPTCMKLTGFEHAARLYSLKADGPSLCPADNESQFSPRHWMAPELLLQNEFSEMSDLFSICALMWELCLGKIPFNNLSYARQVSSYQHPASSGLCLSFEDKMKFPPSWIGPMQMGLQSDCVKRRDLDLREITDSVVIRVRFDDE